MAQPAKQRNKQYIADAKDVLERVRQMRPGLGLLLPCEVECMNIWEVLQGEVTQQRVWTFGRGIGDGSQNTNPSATSGSITLAGPAVADTGQLVCGREPLPVKNGVRFTSCSAGHRHSAAAADGGFVYTWGMNDQGQLGCAAKEEGEEASTSSSNNGASSMTTSGSIPPVAVHAVVMQDASAGERTWAHVDSMQRLAASVKLPADLLRSMGEAHADAASSNEPRDGCAAGTSTSGTAAAAAAAATSAAATAAEQQLCVYRLHVAQAVHMVACGAAHTLVALQGSGLVAWGDNSKGQLGVLPALSQKAVSYPMRVGAFDSVRLSHVSAGSKHSAAVMENGAVCCWGHGRYGRLGIGGEPDMMPPIEVAGLKGCSALQVACGTAHTLALTEDGRLYAWGYNGNGALGMPDRDNRLAPAQVHGLLPCVSIAAAATSMAVACSGEVYIWGGSTLLGSRPLTEGQAHAPLTWLQPHQASAAACGIENAAAVMTDGRLFMWGNRANMPPSLAQQSVALAPVQTVTPKARPGSEAAAHAAFDQLARDGAAADGGDETDDDSFWQLLEEQQRRQQLQEREAFDPDGEQVQQLSCGAAHYVLLCDASVYLPTVGQLRVAVLAVLQAYMDSCTPVTAASEADSIARGDAAAGGPAPTTATLPGAAGFAAATPGTAGVGAAAAEAAAMEGRPALCGAAAAAAAPAAEIGLHGALLLCREMGLVDNLTEHQDVIQAFEAVLHRKRARMGPLHMRKQQQQQQTAATPASQPLMQVMAQTPPATAATAKRRIIPGSAKQAAVAASTGAAAAGSPPLHLVPVLRPGVLTQTTDPLSRLKTAAAAAGAAATAAGTSCASTSASMAVETLALSELLEMLLLLVGERHPQLRRSKEMLLRTLASGYCGRLKGRRADKGPSWLLKQLLQPELLQGFENAASREVLHQAYAFLTGPSANTQDLRMTLGDIRTGLQQEALKAMAPLAATPLPAKPGATVTRATTPAPSGSTTRSRWGQQRLLRTSSGGNGTDTFPEPPASRFTVPLGRLAAFLRAAQLVPPLLSKYIQQLTKQGEEAQKYGRAAALPVMPLMRVDGSRQQGSANNSGPQVPPPLLEASAPGTAASAATSASPDALSSAASSASLGSSRRFRAVNRQSSNGLSSPSNRTSSMAAPGQGGTGLPSFGRLGSFSGRVAGTSQLGQLGQMGQMGQRTLGLSSSFGGGSMRWSSDFGVKSLSRKPVKRGGKSEEALLTAGDDGQFDCSLLDDAELLPVRARRAAILVSADGGAGNNTVPATRASTMRPSVMDPSASGTLPSLPGLSAVPSASGGLFASTAAPVSMSGSLGPSAAVSTMPSPRDAAAGAAAGAQTRRSVTQKQQQLLATLREAPPTTTAAAVAGVAPAAGTAAAGARELREVQDAEAQRQDTWLVYVLAELLGSCLISSHPEGGCSYPPGAVVDLSNHPISYPQFVEVLLLCFAMRVNSMVNPANATASSAKAPLPIIVQPLRWDAEMRDHAKTALARICSWREKMVAPWKAGGSEGGGAGAAGGANRRESLGDGARDRLVMRCYALHGTLLEPQACRFGLARAQFLEFVEQARIVDADLHAQVAKDLFDKLVPKQPPPAAAARDSPQPGQKPTNSARQTPTPTPPPASRGTGAASPAGMRPGMSLAFGRSSTFHRRVAESRLELLKGSALAQDDVSYEEEETAQQQQQQQQQQQRQYQHHQQQQRQEQEEQGEEEEQPGDGDSRDWEVQSSTRTQSPEPQNRIPAYSSDDQQQPEQLPERFNVRPSLAAAQPVPSPTPTPPPSATPQPAVPKQRAMTRQQFLEALKRLAVAKFPAVSHGGTVWRLIVNQHILPHMERKSGVYDEYYATLSTPSVIALLEMRQTQLADLFSEALSAEAAAAAGGTAGTDELGDSQPRLSFRGLLGLLQEREAIPQLLQTCDVEEAAKRVGFEGVPQDKLAGGLTFHEFVQLLCMVGQAVFASKRLHRSHMAPEEKLATFLDLLGLHDPADTSSGLPSSFSEANVGAEGGSSRTGTNTAQPALQLGKEDPYEEWWSMQFEDDAEAGAGQGGAQQLVMLQEMVVRPPGCPRDVDVLLGQATRLHSERNSDQALEMLELAEEQWQDALPGRRLPPEAQLYLAAATSGVLLSAGRDEEALFALERAQWALEALPEGAADAALWHSCAGVVFHALGDAHAAFEHCVRAMVMREECKGLGPAHADTALASHNLACVLDGLGKQHRAKQLLVQAVQTLQRLLGHDHPRTLVAERNLERVRLKAARPQPLTASHPRQSQQGSPSTSQPGAGHSPASRTLQDRLWSLQARRTPAGSSSSAASGAATAATAGQPQRRGLPVGKVARGRRVTSARRKLLHQKDYIDPTYLGGGVHQASPEVRQMYQALLPDIEAHSRTAGGSEGPDVTRQQANLGATSVQIAAGSLGSGFGANRLRGGSGASGSGGLLEMQVGDISGGIAPGQFPRPKPRQLQRGALEDVTVTTVKKALMSKDLIKQRRLEIAARKRAGLIRKPTGLLDRLFGVAAQAPPKGPRQRRKE